MRTGRGDGDLAPSRSHARNRGVSGGKRTFVGEDDGLAIGVAHDLTPSQVLERCRGVAGICCCSDRQC